MSKLHLASQLLGENLFIHPSALSSYRAMIKQLLSGEITSEVKEVIPMAYINSAGIEAEVNDDGQPTEKAVAIIPIRGPIVKFGNWCCWGADEYEWMLDQAYADDNIAAIVLSTHTPGGMVHAMADLAEVIERRNKPVICSVKSMCMSAGVYMAVHCDEIHATNANICQIGAIGTMAIIMDDSKMMEEYGLKEIIIIPPESKDKNDTYFKALEGDNKPMIKYELSPLAVHFQEIVKKHRPNLKAETDRLLTGGEFFAKDALEAGLIDKIMPFNDTIAHALVLAERMEFTNSINV